MPTGVEKQAPDTSTIALTGEFRRNEQARAAFKQQLAVPSVQAWSA